jgi:hypothetical protein
LDLFPIQNPALFHQTPHFCKGSLCFVLILTPNPLSASLEYLNFARFYKGFGQFRSRILHLSTKHIILQGFIRISIELIQSWLVGTSWSGPPPPSLSLPLMSLTKTHHVFHQTPHFRKVS